MDATRPGLLYDGQSLSQGIWITPVAITEPSEEYRVFARIEIAHRPKHTQCFEHMAPSFFIADAMAQIITEASQHQSFLWRKPEPRVHELDFLVDRSTTLLVLVERKKLPSDTSKSAWDLGLGDLAPKHLEPLVIAFDSSDSRVDFHD